MKIVEISEVAENELVFDGNGGYARKMLCVHGNPFYAYIGIAEDASRYYTDEQIDNAAYASDWEEIDLDCCS